MVVIPASYNSDIPPAFIGQPPILYMVAIFSLFMTVLLAAEWLWRNVWALFERPQPLKTPLTAVRVLLISMLSAVIIRVGPDVVLFGAWQDMTPAMRWQVSVTDKMLDVFAFLPFSFAWLISYLGGPIIFYQLEREPLPLHLLPTLKQLARPLKIAAAVLFISAVLVFAR